MPTNETINTESVTRTFEHGPTETVFDAVTLTIPADGWTIRRAGGDEIPVGPNARAYLTHYAMRCLADAFAGIGKSKTVDEADAAFNARWDSLIDDTAGVRGSGVSVPIETIAARNVCRGIVKSRKTKDEYKVWAAGDTVAADLDGLHVKMLAQTDPAKVAKYQEKVAAELEAEKARREAARAKKAGIAEIAGEVEIDF